MATDRQPEGSGAVIDARQKGWRSVMGVPLGAPAINEIPAVAKEEADPLRDFAHRLFARMLQLWREETGNESAWQAAKAHYEWLQQTRPHPGREPESLHRAWVRAENLKNRSGSRFTSQVLKFTGLPPELDPHRIRRAQKLLRRYVADVNGHYVLTGEGSVDVAPGRYVDSGPCLPGLLLDLVALASESQRSNGSDNNPEAAARVMAVELALVRIAQGLQIHFEAAESLGVDGALDRGRAAPTWPLAVALSLLRKPDAREIPWVALLGLAAALGAVLRASARDELLSLPAQEDIWRLRALALLRGLLDGNDASDENTRDQIQPIEELGRIRRNGGNANEALQTALRWLALDGLEDLVRQMPAFEIADSASKNTSPV